MRKLLQIGRADGICLPKPYLRILGAVRGDYFHVFLMDDSTIVIRKLSAHERQAKEINDARATAIVGPKSNIRLLAD